jgi:ABC-type transport system involved in cytochrome c biogenesis permease component
MEHKTDENVRVNQRLNVWIDRLINPNMYMIFFWKEYGRGSLYRVFLMIKTQIRVRGDLIVGGWGCISTYLTMWARLFLRYIILMNINVLFLHIYFNSIFLLFLTLLINSFHFVLRGDIIHAIVLKDLLDT